MAEDIQVNTTVTGAQFNSTILVQSDHSYWVVWGSSASDASARGIYGQHFDADGNELGSEVRFKAGTVNWPIPWLLPDDGWVLTWYGPGDGSGTGVFGQRYDADGNAVGSQFQANTSTAGNQQIFGSTVALEGGGWVVIWDSGDDPSLGIHGQLFDASGNKVGGEFRVDATHGDAQYTNWIEPMADGGWLVSYSSSTPAYDFYTYVRRYDADGNSVGDEFQFTTEQSSMSLFRPMSDGGWVAAWNSTQAADADGGVFSRRYDANSDPLGDEVMVNTTTDGGQGIMDIELLADGGWVVLWTTYKDYDPVTFYPKNDVFFQRYDAAGNPVGGETQIDTGAYAGGWATSLADGGWVVHWWNYDADGTGVAAQRYDAGGNPVGDIIQVNAYTTGDQGPSSVEALPDGGWVVSWDSDGQDGSGQGVFMQRFDADGYPVGSGSGGGGASPILGTSGNDTLLGTAGNDTIDALGGDDSLNGAAGDDTLYGGNGADVLYGAAGVDALYGGKGNDTYLMDNTGDVIHESPGEGTDTVKSAYSFVLPANVEKLILVGTNAVDGTGNGLANQITGNGAANLLNGAAGADTLMGGEGNDTLNGGAGADTMKGNKGNDVFLVDNTGDKPIEYAGQGYDTVKSGVSFTLADNIEKLVLTGASAINGTGNGLKNVLVGNSAKNKLWGNDDNDKLVGNNGSDSLYGGNGNDTLQGGGHGDLLVGGAGNDLLTGGGGPDAFLFNSALNAATNVDTITDFMGGTDQIHLDDDIFTSLGPVSANTPLASAKFHQGAGATSAHDATDRIIYDTSSGALYYDADGLGGTAAVKFTSLGITSHPAVDAGDFLVVV